MLSLRKPGAESISRFLAAQTTLHLTYRSVGATATQPPAGYVVDHTRVMLGKGERVFTAAVAAMRRWEQLHLGWLEVSPIDAPIRKEQVVGILARSVGLWWLNACRIVYVVEESGPINKFGFANGTLPAHAGSGEERFLIEWNRADDSVWYDILAFSRPRHLLAKIGYPMVRRTQKRFGRESAAAMQRAIKSACRDETGSS